MAEKQEAMIKYMQDGKEREVFFFAHSFKTAYEHADEYIERNQHLIDMNLYYLNMSSFGEKWQLVKRITQTNEMGKSHMEQINLDHETYLNTKREIENNITGLDEHKESLLTQLMKTNHGSTNEMIVLRELRDILRRITLAEREKQELSLAKWKYELPIVESRIEVTRRNIEVIEQESKQIPGTQRGENKRSQVDILKGLLVEQTAEACLLEKLIEGAEAE